MCIRDRFGGKFLTQMQGFDRILNPGSATVSRYLPIGINSAKFIYLLILKVRRELANPSLLFYNIKIPRNLIKAMKRSKIKNHNPIICVRPHKKVPCCRFGVKTRGSY